MCCFFVCNRDNVVVYTFQVCFFVCNRDNVVVYTFQVVGSLYQFLFIEKISSLHRLPLQNQVLGVGEVRKERSQSNRHVILHL